MFWSLGAVARVMRTAWVMKRAVMGAFALMVSALGCSDTVNSVPPEDASTTQDVTPDVAADAGGPCVFPTGEVCARGATCPDPDGCNTCMCSATGQLACTARACVDAGPTQDVPPPRDVPDIDVSRPDAATVPCWPGSTCPTGTRCVWIAGLCGSEARGTCQNTSGCESLPVAPQYCGCDGVTFTVPSACPPSAPYRSDGVCPAVDGGSPDVPHVDAGAPDVAVDAGASRYAGARMSWESPGGFAGWGPAVIVRGDGTVNTWRMANGFGTGEPARTPDETITVSPAAIDDLFSRWERADTGRLPHGTATSADCYPRVTVRLCERCETRDIMYQHPSQLTPEMNEVWAWFATHVPSTQPSSFCAF